ncbi:cysteine desulfurase [Cerasicoccus maritimus]|uniref:cysteine desulfurase n=1 Tax=Cerasicoccus maritimus TaxID=490089 RepID=UPI002852CBAC|nr:cysteine desulfurase [Cerasicoccus maritimus]
MILDRASLAAQWDVASVRADFPILGQQVNGHPLVYLDNAATAQKPLAVIERLDAYYRTENANIHRGVHALSQEATGAYEAARASVAKFIGTPESRSCIFTRNATEAINLVAATWGSANIGAGDEIVVSHMEHHANIVPWQLLADRVGATIKVIPVTDIGELDLDALPGLLTERVKLLSLCHVSNSLGTINPVEQIIPLAKTKGITVLIDGAQSTAHFPVNVSALGCDFLVFSGHKVCGPTGIGVLWGKPELLNAMPPYQGGGDMIDRVSFDGTTYRQIPERFEAGTPHIAGAIGLGAAVEYLMARDQAALDAYERELLGYATEQLKAIKGLKIYGESAHKVSVVSFVIDGVHPADLGTMLDMDGIAIRTGHHCTMPLWARFGLEGSARASFAFYNTLEEVDALVKSIKKAQMMLG